MKYSPATILDKSFVSRLNAISFNLVLLCMSCLQKNLTFHLMLMTDDILAISCYFWHSSNRYQKLKKYSTWNCMQFNFNTILMLLKYEWNRYKNAIKNIQTNWHKTLFTSSLPNKEKTFKSSSTILHFLPEILHLERKTFFFQFIAVFYSCT